MLTQSVEIQALVPTESVELRSLWLIQNGRWFDITWGLYDQRMLNDITVMWTLKGITLNDQPVRAKNLAEIISKACQENTFYVTAADLDNNGIIPELKIQKITIRDTDGHTLTAKTPNDGSVTPKTGRQSWKTEIMIVTPEHRLVRCLLEKDMSEQSALNLFHKILSAEGKKEPFKVDEILNMPASVLTKYGVRFEYTGCSKYLFLKRSRLLPHAVP